MHRYVATLLCLGLCAPPLHAAAASFKPLTEAESARLAARVSSETRHAWRGYMRYAAGHDALRPLSRQPHDWYAHSLLMTPVDAYDTLLLMGLDTQARQAHELIVTQLNFDRDIYVKHFEMAIRLLGGLLSGYQHGGDPQLLALAEDLARRMLPVFDSPTGLPYAEVNLRTGQVRGAVSGPAETGTLLLEYGTLSRLTGRSIYYDKAKRALTETFRRRSAIGLVGSGLNVQSGAWTDADSHIGGGIDSYYEYLYKCWKLFGDADCRGMWDESIAAVNRYLAEEVRGELWYGHADMNSGARASTSYGALDAFFPGLLALSGDIGRARRLQESGLRMWRLNHMEPEALDYGAMRVTNGEYALRPEIIESAYYLYHFTHDPRYRAMGREFFQDFVRRCRTGAGYAALQDVRTGQQADSMESFLFAETFKYYYLLFAKPGVLDFDAIVFNTEAHPLMRVPAAGARAAAPDQPPAPRRGVRHGRPPR